MIALKKIPGNNAGFTLKLICMFTLFTTSLHAQENVFPGADSTTPSLAHYFTWINNTEGIPPQDQTLINLDFFQWLKDEYGMKLDIYAYDAGIIDRGGRYETLESELFKKHYPESFGPVAEKAASMGIRLGAWLGPDGFGNTPEEEKIRREMLVSLCRDYNFRLFKMDLMLTQLRPEKQDAFIRAMKECRNHTPDLIVLNHRVDFGKAAPYVTTNLWNGDETYIDVHMTNNRTATHHRVAAISRGLTPGLNRMLEDHGVCLSSCLDYWEDDLIMQAFNRNLLLAPELYGNPWFLRDDEYPRLARIFNLHRLYNDILIHGMVLPEDQYGKNAVSRGDKNTRLITLSNISWDPVSYKLSLNKSIGLEAEGEITLVQYHPYEKIIGRFNYGEEIPVEVLPFRSALFMVTNVELKEPFIEGCEYELIQNVPGKDVRIKLMGMPGKESVISLNSSRNNFTSAYLEGEYLPDLIEGRPVKISFAGKQLTKPWHRKLGDLSEVKVPDDAEAQYEASCYSADNNALEVRSLFRSGSTKVPQVKKARDAFFEQEVFIRKGVWDKFMFDGDKNTSFNILHRLKDYTGGAFRIDFGLKVKMDSICIILPDSQSLGSLKNNTDIIAQISPDLKSWKNAYISASGKTLTVYLNNELAARYFRLSNAPGKITEVEGYFRGVKITNSSWKGSNLFPLYSNKPAVKAWKITVNLTEAAKGSYLSVPVQGEHGYQGVYAVLKMGDKITGASDRSPSFIANVWEYRVQKRESNYTFYFPVTEEMIGQPFDVYVMARNQEQSELKPEVWITAYPIPFETKELVLKRNSSISFLNNED